MNVQMARRLQRLSLTEDGLMLTESIMGKIDQNLFVRRPAYLPKDQVTSLARRGVSSYIKQN